MQAIMSPPLVSTLANMNKQLETFARRTIKEGLDYCTDEQQMLFKRLYAHGNLSLPVCKVVDQMPASQLECAMDQVERTIKKNIRDFDDFPDRNHANEYLLAKVFPAEGEEVLHHGARATVDRVYVSADRVRLNYPNGATGLANKADLVPFNIVDYYFKIQKELFKYFGYKEDWKVIPPDSCTGYYWMICGPENDNSTNVVWSTRPFTKEVIEKGATIYSGTIYTPMLLPKWVYRGPCHTMISVDTHTDGNLLLIIFDNDKECTDQAMKDAYNERWLT